MIGIQDIDIFGMGIVHSNSVPFHLEDNASLTLTGKKD